MLVRATLILFDVVEPGVATDVLVAPEILWEASLGLHPLLKGFRTPAPPEGSRGLRTGGGRAAASVATG